MDGTGVVVSCQEGYDRVRTSGLRISHKIRRVHCMKKATPIYSMELIANFLCINSNTRACPKIVNDARIEEGEEGKQKYSLA